MALVNKVGLQATMWSEVALLHTVSLIGTALWLVSVTCFGLNKLGSVSSDDSGDVTYDMNNCNKCANKKEEEKFVSCYA